MSLDTDFVPLAPLSSDTRHGVIPLFAENFKTGGIFVTKMFESRMNETYSRIVSGGIKTKTALEWKGLSTT